MKKIKYLLVMALAIFASASLAACHNYDEPEPSAEPQPDPEGTYKIYMTAGDEETATILNEHVYITNKFNWRCKYNNIRILDVGVVSGLSAITTVPNGDWKSICPVVPHHGYILKEDIGYPSPYRYSIYTRIYVVDWIEKPFTGIIGATVKYQPDWNLLRPGDY